MSQHTALFLDSKCGKFVLGYNPTPKPGEGELLVRVEAVGLNPVDWNIQKWGLFIENYPVILGTDTGGVVVEVGPGVSGFSVGDRVLYQGAWANDRGSYQQYNLATAALVAKIPNFLSFEAAATIPVATLAAFLGLYNSKPYGAGYAPPLAASDIGRYAGKPLVVLGGSGAVGQAVIQFGKLSGFSPIITTTSLHQARYLKSLGATHIIDRHSPLSSLRDEVAKITQTPIELVYDAVSTADTQKAGYDLLAANGSLVVVLNPEVQKVDEKEVYHVFTVPSLPHTIEISKKFYGCLGKWLEEGSIKPNRIEILPQGLEGVVEGLAKLENGRVSGTKLVARPQLTGPVQREKPTLQIDSKPVEQAKQKVVNGTAKRKSLLKRILS